VFCGEFDTGKPHCAGAEALRTCFGHQTDGHCPFRNEVDPIATKKPENALRRGGRANGEGVSVFTVDDQAVFRSVAREVIAATPGFESAGEAHSGEAALTEMTRSHPDLVLIDVRMPGMGGVEAARRIAATQPEAVIVLISIEDPEVLGDDVRLCGAAELVRKQDFGPSLLRRLWDRHGGSPRRRKAAG
jgi:two-component system, NarL family, invasion response regulator UvrY